MSSTAMLQANRPQTIFIDGVLEDVLECLKMLDGVSDNRPDLCIKQLEKAAKNLARPSFFQQVSMADPFFVGKA